MKVIAPVSKFVNQKEYSLLATLLICWLISYLNAPFANLLLILSFSAIAFLYALSAYAHIATENSLAKFTGKLSGIASCVTLVGCLYALMHWPGSKEMLIAGSSALAITVIALLTSYARGKKLLPNHNKLMVRVSSIMVGASVLLFS